MRLAEENPHLPIHKAKKEINSFFFGLHLVSDLDQHTSEPRGAFGSSALGSNAQPQAARLNQWPCSHPLPAALRDTHSCSLSPASALKELKGGAERKDRAKSIACENAQALSWAHPRGWTQLPCPTARPWGRAQPWASLCPARSATAPEGKRLEELQEELVGRQVWASNRDKHRQQAGSADGAD